MPRFAPLSLFRAITPLILAFSRLARASGGEGLDESVQFAARLFPHGAAIAATAGYGRILWGDNDGGGFRYGYVRPFGTLSSSILVNRAETGIELFPISFFGLRAGLSGSQRTTNLDTINCSVVYCHGLLGTAYLKPRLLLGYGPISTLASMRAAWLKSSNSGQSFGDEQSDLVAVAGGDQMISAELAVIIRLSPTYQIGGYTSTDHMLGSGATNNLMSGFGRYVRGPWSVTVGLGAYESSTQLRGFTCFSIVGWTGLPSIALN